MNPENSELKRKLKGAAVRLQHLSETYLPRAKFGKLSKLDLEHIGERVPLSDDLLIWYQTVAPLNCYIPWTGNKLFLADPHDLISYQIGYRWRQGNELEMDALWQSSWVVIGDIGADPVIAHVDQINTPISVAMHGVGAWEPRQVTPNLITYLNIVSDWIELYGSKYQMKKTNILNTDGSPIREIVSDIHYVLAKYLDSEHHDNFFWTMWSE